MLATVEGHRGVVRAVAALADGRVVSGAADGTLRVWDLARGAAVAVFTLDAPVFAVAVGSGGVVIAGDSSGGVHSFDVVG